MRRQIAVVVGAAALAGAGSAAGAAGPTVDLCDRFGPVAEVGVVGDPALDEISGLAASRRHPGVLWAHNDSGGGPDVHALAPDGAALGTYRIEGAEARDWEDMAVGPGVDPEHPALYLGDIGDNAAEAPSVTIYRAAEPDLPPDGTDRTLPVLDATEVRYPDGPADAEALLVEPATGDVLILTKAYLGPSQVLRVAAASLGASGAVEAEWVAELQVPLDLALGGGLPGTAVTSADVAPDGRFVLVRTYQAVLAYPRPAGGPLTSAFGATPCAGPTVDEAQGESLAIAHDGRSYATVSEGESPPLHVVPIEPAPSPTAGDDDEDEAPAADDPGGGAVVVVAVLLLIALTGIAVWWRRTRREEGALPSQGEDSGEPDP